MKATGIVRRIDDLGRVVIPKEIRRTMRIREGDPLEIYTDREGEVIFKKYSPIGELNTFASQYAETLAKSGNLSVLICDRDAVIAIGGVSKKEYMDKSLSKDLDGIMQQRSVYRYEDEVGGDKIYPTEEGEQFISCAMPIISEGDVIGCVVSLRGAQSPKRDASAAEVEAKLIITAASFLGKQMES
jgi:AbrB family transcriptional regulator (stage V sporulation protein T)